MCFRFVNIFLLNTHSRVNLSSKKLGKGFGTALGLEPRPADTKESGRFTKREVELQNGIQKSDPLQTILLLETLVWKGGAGPAQFLVAHCLQLFKSFWGKDFFPAKEFLSWTIDAAPEEMPDGGKKGFLINAMTERKSNV